MFNSLDIHYRKKISLNSKNFKIWQFCWQAIIILQDDHQSGKSSKTLKGKYWDVVKPKAQVIVAMIHSLWINVDDIQQERSKIERETVVVSGEDGSRYRLSIALMAPKHSNNISLIKSYITWYIQILLFFNIQNV